MLTSQSCLRSIHTIMAIVVVSQFNLGVAKHCQVSNNVGIHTICNRQVPVEFHPSQGQPRRSFAE